MKCLFSFYLVFFLFLSGFIAPCIQTKQRIFILYTIELTLLLLQEAWLQALTWDIRNHAVIYVMHGNIEVYM